MADEAQRPADREPVVTIEHSATDPDIFYMTAGGRCATFWHAVNGYWYAGLGRGNLRPSGDRRVEGYLSAQVLALELLGIE